MTRSFWTEVYPSTMLKNLLGISLLGLTDNGAVAFEIRADGTYASTRRTSGWVADADAVQVEYWRSGSGTATLEFPETARLSKVMERLGVHSVVSTPTFYRPNRSLTGIFYAGAALLLFSLVVLGDAMPAFMFQLPLAGLIALLAPYSVRRSGEPRILVAGVAPLSITEAGKYASARLAGERPELKPAKERAQAAHDRVEQIRADYGALKIDIVARIEQPALFDEACPTTAAFLEALIAYDDAVSVEAKELAAADVEMSYSVALAHAESVGLAHFPEHARDEARRAAKAARLAAGAATDGERVASLTQVKRILDSLALYYLPNLDERLAIEGGER